MVCSLPLIEIIGEIWNLAGCTASYSVQLQTCAWTLNKRDIQTVPAFLREGGDGLLSLEHHHFPQTSTVVPFEGNVGEAACKNEVGRKNPEKRSVRIYNRISPLRRGMKKSGGKGDRRGFCTRSDPICRPKYFTNQ